jgi:hypothetical protein
MSSDQCELYHKLLSARRDFAHKITIDPTLPPTLPVSWQNWRKWRNLRKKVIQKHQEEMVQRQKWFLLHLNQDVEETNRLLRKEKRGQKQKF